MTSTLAQRARYKLIPLLLKASLYLASPRLTAFLLAVSVLPQNPSGRYTVLCLRRSVFTDDIKAMVKYSGRIKYLILNRGDLKRVLFHFLPKKTLEGLTEDNYHQGGIPDSCRLRYKDYLRTVWPYLLKRLKFQAVFAGNVGYVEQQELAALCEELRFPFIVLHKEGMAVQDQYTEYAKIYRTRIFIGSKILFYNKNIKQALFSIGLPGLTEEKSVVVGIPRLDEYFDMAPPRREVKTVTFFSFYPHDKMRYLVNDEEAKKKIFERSANFHKLVMEFAQNHPGISVVIKTKFAEHYLKYVEDIRDSLFIDVPENLFITNTANTTELIRNSDAVIGFNSTTLVEAIVASRLVISPYFGDFIPDKSWDYFAKYPELISYAKTGHQLAELILRPENFMRVSAERKTAFLKELIFTPDGKACQRAEDEIIKLIREYAENKV